MNKLSKTALTAFLATAVGATTFASASYAQGPEGGWDFSRIEHSQARFHRPDGDHAQRMMGGDLIGTLMSGRGAEAIDVAAVRLTHRLELTDDQIALLDDLKAQALTAHDDLAGIREDLLPIAEEDAANPDLIARYAGMVAMTTARAEALETMQPAFEAFVDSLTDEQVEKLTPEHGPAMMRGMRTRG